MRIIVLLLCLFPTVVKAQFQDLSYGPVAGLNISNIAGDFFDDADNRYNLYFGGFAEMPIIGPWGVRSEMLYSAQGAITEVLTAEVIWKLVYMNIPIMVKYQAYKGLNLMTGMQLGVLLSAKTELESSVSNLETNVEDEFKGAGFSWVIGAEYQLEMGLGLGIRYNLGLSNIDDTDFAEAENRVFQIGASFAF